MSEEVFKTDKKYIEDYKYYCTGYLGQTLGSDNLSGLKQAIKGWPDGDYDIKENNDR